MQREGSWARIAWSGGKLSTMETVGHVVRVTKQLTAEPGLNGWVTMAVEAHGLGAGVYDRLIERRDPWREDISRAGGLRQPSFGVVLETAPALRERRHRY
jgi:hypothetical protein